MAGVSITKIEMSRLDWHSQGSWQDDSLGYETTYPQNNHTLESKVISGISQHLKFQKWVTTEWQVALHGNLIKTIKEDAEKWK